MTADMLLARELRSGEETKPRRRMILVFGTLLILGCIAYALIWDRIKQSKAALRDRSEPATVR
jgi:type II secretory pathway component PulM